MTDSRNKWLVVGGRWPAADAVNQPTAGQTNNESGFTLLELIITLTIIAIMVSGTVPFAYNMIKREKELELRRNLRDIRKAIDDYCNKWPLFSPLDKVTQDCYPPNLQTLVEGVPQPNKPDEPFRFLRRIPVDPFTGNTDWGLRSMEDDPFSASGSGPSQANGTWDVYSKASGKALDGTEYNKW